MYAASSRCHASCLAEINSRSLLHRRSFCKARALLELRCPATLYDCMQYTQQCGAVNLGLEARFLLTLCLFKSASPEQKQTCVPSKLVASASTVSATCAEYDSCKNAHVCTCMLTCSGALLLTFGLGAPRLGNVRPVCWARSSIPCAKDTSWDLAT